MDWHPLIVHFPIVLLPLSAALDLCAHWRGRRDWHNMAYALWGLGVLAALIAVLSGSMAADPHWQQEDLRAVLSNHEDWATATLIAALVVLLGRLPLHLKGQAEGRSLFLWTAAALVVSALIWVTAYYGGELVYIYGVGVRGNG